MCGSGAQTIRGEEGLAEGDGGGVRLQTVPLRAGGRKSNATKCDNQPSHRHEVDMDVKPVWVLVSGLHFSCLLRTSQMFVSCALGLKIQTHPAVV